MLTTKTTIELPQLLDILTHLTGVSVNVRWGRLHLTGSVKSDFLTVEVSTLILGERVTKDLFFSLSLNGQSLQNIRVKPKDICFAEIVEVVKRHHRQAVEALEANVSQLLENVFTLSHNEEIKNYEASKI